MALHAYESCREMLAEELGVAPAPETEGLAECGEYDEALTLAEDVVAEARSRDDQPGIVMGLIALSMVQRAVCAFEDACAMDEEALRLGEAGARSIPLASVAAMNLCADYALLGKWNIARDYVQRAMDIGNGVWLFLAGTIPWWLKIGAFLHAGDREGAQAVIGRLESYVGTYRRLRLPHLRSQAVLAEWDDDTNRAITCLKEALALAERIGLPGERWQILADLSKLYRTQGDDDRAHDARVRATETVRELAAGIADEAMRAAFLEAAPASYQTR